MKVFRSFTTGWFAMQKRYKGSHKVVADCVEALIGAHYVTGGELGASAFMRHIGLLPPMPSTAWQLPAENRAADSPSSRLVPVPRDCETFETVILPDRQSNILSWLVLC